MASSAAVTPTGNLAKGKTMMRMRERSVATNGLDMHILEAGEGKPLVLLHGGTLTSASGQTSYPWLLSGTTCCSR
jgi:hypothetical protein